MAEQIMKFIGVGAIATAIQYAILIVLSENEFSGPILASTAGYVVSSIFNYVVNYYFTFKSSERQLVAFTKFTLVVIVGLGLNSIIMFFTVEKVGIHYLIGQITSTFFVLIWNYSAHRYWTYRIGFVKA